MSPKKVLVIVAQALTPCHSERQVRRKANASEESGAGRQCATEVLGRFCGSSAVPGSMTSVLTQLPPLPQIPSRPALLRFADMVGAQHDWMRRRRLRR